MMLFDYSRAKFTLRHAIGKTCAYLEPCMRFVNWFFTFLMLMPEPCAAVYETNEYKEFHKWQP